MTSTSTGRPPDRTSASRPGAAAVGGAAVGGGSGGFCRVRVAGPKTSVDLALPAGVPLARLLPELLRHAGEPAVPGGWVLSRIDGVRLDPGAGLAAAGVREGDLLVLHPASEFVPPPLYDDVVEVIAAEGVGTAWGLRQTRLACAVVAALGVLGALLAAAAGPDLLSGVLAVVTALLLLLGGGALSRAVGDGAAGTLAAALAAPAAAVGAAQLLGGSWGRGHLLLACAAVLLVAVLGPVVVGGGHAVFAAFGLAALLGIFAALIAVLTGTTPARAAAVIAPAALALTTVLPTLALRVAGLPRPELPRSTDELAEVPGEVDLRLVQDQVQRARQLLSGLAAGCHVAVAVGIGVLLVASETWSWILAAVLALLVLLRARLFRERGQVLAPIAAAALALVVGMVVAVRQSEGDPTLLLGVAASIALGVALLATAVGVGSGRVAPNPSRTRSLDIVETVLLLAVVPLALAVWDVYERLLDLGA
ncbi:MAG: type VII secretion integral membrane protein EccD [Pseudonocardiales bacterium]